MTTHSRAGQVGVTAYYLGRPAGFWLAALAPRPTARRSLPSSCLSESALLGPNHAPGDEETGTDLG
jgi:hypothetical protein